MAQEDLLIKKNGDRLNIKVTEIGDETVRYKGYSNQSGPDFVISRNAFVRIELADGTVVPGIDDDDKGKGKNDGDDKKVHGDDKNGFLGLSVGVNTLMEDYSNVTSTGVEGNLTFGYLFSRIVGISVSGFINRHNVESGYSGVDAKSNLYGIYAGPLFSIPAGSRNTLRINLIPYAGFAKMKISASASGSSGSQTLDGEFAAGINSMVVWRFADMWALTGGVEARYLKIGGDDFSSVRLSAGIALCF
jgi:hypothetical protein